MGVVISWIQSNLADGENDDRQGEARDENQSSSLSGEHDSFLCCPYYSWMGWKKLTTTTGMVNTLIPVIVVSVVYLIIFIATRRSQKRFYTPRSYLGSLRDQ